GTHRRLDRVRRHRQFPLGFGTWLGESEGAREMTTLPAHTGEIGKRSGVVRRFLKKPLGVISLVVFVLVLLVAFLAPVLAPYDPNLVDLSIAKAPPSGEHWLGGDPAGRDLLSRLVYGARTTIGGGAIAVVT